MRDDALPAGKFVRIGAALPGAITFAIVVVASLLAHRHVPPGGQGIARPTPLAQDLPMLQSAPQTDLATYRLAQRRALDGLGWVDAASGVAHIPIEAAMALQAARAASAASPGASR